MEKILVVDDDKDLLLILQHALKGNGYNVTTLEDGGKVLEIMDTVKPDIIILDIDLGKWNGMDICAAIKQKNIYKGIPVVLYSGKQEEETALINCKADLYLQKPLSTNFFLRKIAALTAA